MVINFICRASKANANGFSPLELSIIINKKRRIISLDMRLKSSSFNPKTQRFRANKIANEYIDSVTNKVYSIVTEMNNKNMEINVETFVDIFKHGFESNNISILSLLHDHIEDLKVKSRAGQITSTTVDKYVVTRGYIIKYLKSEYNKDDILVKDITPLFVDNFYTYLLKYMANICMFYDILYQ